jgi:hypothetical protein
MNAQKIAYFVAGTAICYMLYKMMTEQNTPIASSQAGDYDIPYVKLDQPRIDYEKTIRAGMDAVKARYGISIAQSVERIFRLETNHFRSGGWKATLAPGMHPFAKKQPYNWSSLRAFWDATPAARPIGVDTLTEGGTNLKRDYLVFNNIGGFLTLAEVMKIRGNNPGTWYSTDPTKISQYNGSLSSIKTHYA